MMTITRSDSEIRVLLTAITAGIPAQLPAPRPYDPGVSHAPRRQHRLTVTEQKLALKNALRYFPKDWHVTLAPEFKTELQECGHIYMYRFQPLYPIKAYPIDWFPAKCRQAAAIMLMYFNNLDPAVAQHPQELITYGGNGSVFSNWAQFLLTMQYLSQMTDHQTLTLNSGHPQGLYPSHPDAPRLIISNGMTIPNYSKRSDYDRLYALGVSQYGQMTAGSAMYIGPQGIVHGTTITILNAGRRILAPGETNLQGKVFVTAGLGGMSGAQPKATVLCGGICVVAEINNAATDKRLAQGWVDEAFSELPALLDRIRKAKTSRQAVSLAYRGNVVDLWEALAESDLHIELGSDQTSLHIPYSGGYYPQGLSLAEANALMVHDPDQFQKTVQASLRRQVAAINKMVARGMHFWDYGNAFLKEAREANADILTLEGEFKYLSYVQEIMGPLFFDYGFGPFRWICTSGLESDLATTDALAAEVLEAMLSDCPSDIQTQLSDNLLWIRQAKMNQLVVGSQSRILYADLEGRVRLGLAFNRAIREGRISAPVVLGRDHHDVSGTDSPYRETSNIYDGSNLTADMAVQNFAGDAARGATWVSLHNGGGVGWGEVVNGGFGLVLDGSDGAERRAAAMLHWDVANGVSRRNWAGNEGATITIKRTMDRCPDLRVTVPVMADPALIDTLFMTS